MTLLRLALRDIGRSAFRSWAVGLSALLVAGLAFGVLLVSRGAHQAVSRVSDRLGADVLVVPAGTGATVESALLMGSPSDRWMPASHVTDIGALPGVSKASAQVYLASLANASCCSVSDMFLVAFDPETDFTVQPWVDEATGHGGLGVGESLGGSLVTVPDGEPGITLYGYPLTLKAHLAPTGTNLDRSLFITMGTARAMASSSVTSAVSPLEVREGSVSAILVKVRDGSDAAGVASLIESRIANVDAVPEAGLFSQSRRSIDLAFRSLLALLGVAAGFALLFIALVSAMAAHERRRETGVLRALGVTRPGVIGVQVVQSVVLTAGGGVIGVGISALVTYLFRDLLIERLGFPFLYPAAGELVLLALGGIAALATGVAVAVAIPTGLTSLGEPAATMRS